MSFNGEPYAEALNKGIIQDEILLAACKQLNDIKDLDTENIMQKIRNEFNDLK